MSTRFTRTPTGIVGKWHFHTEPTIWVEGGSDIYFYIPIVEGIKCRLEPFFGVENARALIDGLKHQDLPYVVVLDGDYSILDRKRSPHRRIIRLRRYSFENYLWEKEPFNRCCLRHAQSGETTNESCDEEFDRLTSRMHDKLLQLVVLDVAARDSDPAPKALPDRVEQLLKKPTSPDIDDSKVERLINTVSGQIDSGVIVRAKSAVSRYLDKHRLADLLRGHILFGLLRLLFAKVSTEIRGSKVILNDDALIQLLATATWQVVPTNDHRVLKQSIRKQVRTCLKMFA